MIIQKHPKTSSTFEQHRQEKRFLGAKSHIKQNTELYLFNLLIIIDIEDQLSLCITLHNSKHLMINTNQILIRNFTTIWELQTVFTIL